MDLSFSQIFIGGCLAGLAGAAMMNGFMRTISARFSQRVNMIAALGSLLTGKVDKANLVGSVVHAASGAFFGVVYLFLLNLTSISFVPALAAMGLGLGFIHGLVVSYGLMVVVSEHHPVPGIPQSHTRNRPAPPGGTCPLRPDRRPGFRTRLLRFSVSFALPDEVLHIDHEHLSGSADKPVDGHVTP
jgi:hypothetical protein